MMMIMMVSVLCLGKLQYIAYHLINSLDRISEEKTASGPKISVWREREREKVWWKDATTSAKGKKGDTRGGGRGQGRGDNTSKLGSTWVRERWRQTFSSLLLLPAINARCHQIEKIKQELHLTDDSPGRQSSKCTVSMSTCIFLPWPWPSIYTHWKQTPRLTKGNIGHWQTEGTDWLPE